MTQNCESNPLMAAIPPEVAGTSPETSQGGTLVLRPTLNCLNLVRRVVSQGASR